jgi:NADPH2:quinone reductase
VEVPATRTGSGRTSSAVLELLRADKIHPAVAERLPLADARRAHELLEQSASVGKLVLVP